MMRLLFRTAVTGSIASLVSASALMLLARSEGKGSLQPLNATSHWLQGDRAGHVKRGDIAHTAVGFLTHHASAIFWALLLERFWGGGARPAPALLRDGFAMSALAAAVDYGLTPKRLTPGWEIPLSTRSMILAYGALAVGFAAGAVVTHRPFNENKRPG